jgi:hypothetical protein
MGMILMKVNSKILEGLRITNNILNDIIFMCETRTKQTYFTRSEVSKLGFKNIIVFILNFVTKSLQIELDDFLNLTNGSDISVSKQAFSEARKKISPTAFIKMTDGILKWFYNDTDFKLYKEYRLLAIDGSVLEISNTEELREKFGYVENQSVKVARAQASGLYDVENDMMLATTIAKYKTPERTLAIELINKLENLGFKNDLILFDRGYPSKDLISLIETKQVKYLMRVSSNFIKEVNQAKEQDQVISVKHKDQTLHIRVLKFKLDSGVEEVLITNIVDKSFDVDSFKELYFKRWNIEVKYDELKNRLQLENFTGETTIAIEQDFYAAMYLTNMVSLAKMDANAAIEEKNKGKNLKYEYKVNTNVLIGKLKDSLVLMMLQQNPRKRSSMLKKIMKEVSRNVIPIRPGRSNPRVKKSRNNKFITSRKRAL